LYFRYTRHLTAARRSGVRKGAVFGGIMGFIRLIIFLIYAVGFIYGTRLIHEEHSNIGDIFVVNDFSLILFKFESIIYLLGFLCNFHRDFFTWTGSKYVAISK
jgi:hypothetical protein